MKLRIALFILAVATMAAFGLFTQANAGCLGGYNEGRCIGIPTPREHREHYRYEDHDHDAVVIHRHRHRAPPMIMEHDDDED